MGILILWVIKFCLLFNLQFLAVTLYNFVNIILLSELGNYIEKKKYIVIGFIAGC